MTGAPALTTTAAAGVLASRRVTGWLGSTASVLWTYLTTEMPGFVPSRLATSLDVTVTGVVPIVVMPWAVAVFRYGPSATMPW